MKVEDRPSRRQWAGKLIAGIGASTLGTAWLARNLAAQTLDGRQSKPTNFQIACMTLPYQHFSVERAFQGIASAGYEYVAWGTKHLGVPLLAASDPPAKARGLASQCHDLGLKPIMMFSSVAPEDSNAIEVMTQKIRQASAAGIGQVLTFGHITGGDPSLWVRRLKKLAPVAMDHEVTIVVKQHGGATGTGEACARVTRQVGSPWVKINYDAGNVLDYMKMDPISDLKSCIDELRSFCIKDHRHWPQDQDCGPGYGEVDHYQLLAPVASLGRDMPLACENIFRPLVDRPETPEELDALARRAREYVETVVTGLANISPSSALPQ